MRNETTNSRLNILGQLKDLERAYISLLKQRNESIIVGFTVLSKYISKNIKALKKIKYKDIQSRLLKAKIDPFYADSNFVKFSDYDYDEPRWTQWLKNCLNDKYVGSIFWRAICMAVIDKMRSIRISDSSSLNRKNKYARVMTVNNWNEALNFNSIQAFAECRRTYGKPDITINAGPYKILIENKISAPEGEGQLGRYKRGMVARPADSKGIGLIYLTNDDRSESCETGFINILYENFGINLRKETKKTLIERKVPELYLWPVMSTLVSIEQGLLNLPPLDALSQDGELLPLAKIAKYLHETEGENEKF